MEPVFELGLTKSSVAWLASQYAPEAHIELATAVIVLALRAWKISPASSVMPATSPPGESTSNTIALTVGSLTAWRSCAVMPSQDAPPKNIDQNDPRCARIP